jgi:ubiquinone/menaquinone biosynthesis C-methylase UbiE
MKMTAIEKHFVNGPQHTARVADRAVQLLERIDIQGARRYLDVGCGVGEADWEVARRSGLEVTGVDVDPAQIEIAQSHGADPHVSFVAMDATKLEFGDAEFDVVASSMMGHHLRDWEQALAEMIRVLRPGGHLIYTDLTFPSWFAATGRRLLPFVALPSANRAETVASKAGLTKVFESRTGMRREFIWMKNG